MDDPIIPHLKIIHAHPSAFRFRTLRIDRGAIRFVLSGAALMVPGLTSAGGHLPTPGAPLEEGSNGNGIGSGSGRGGERETEQECKKGDVVVIRAEGKEEICMVGVLDVGTEEMKKNKKGVAISAGHYLGDGLWKLELS